MIQIPAIDCNTTYDTTPSPQNNFSDSFRTLSNTSFSSNLSNIEPRDVRILETIQGSCYSRCTITITAMKDGSS